MDLKERLDNVDRLGYDPVLLELLAVVKLLAEYEQELLGKLEEDEIPSLEYENSISSYQVSLYKRIMSKMGLEEYYDIDDSYWNTFADFERGNIGIGKLIEEIKTSLRYTYVPPIEVVKN